MAKRKTTKRAKSTSTTRTFKDGDVAVKIVVTDANNVRAGKKSATTKTRRKRRVKRSNDGNEFYL